MAGVRSGRCSEWGFGYQLWHHSCVFCVIPLFQNVWDSMGPPVLTLKLESCYVLQLLLCAATREPHHKVCCWELCVQLREELYVQATIPTWTSHSKSVPKSPVTVYLIFQYLLNACQVKEEDSPGDISMSVFQWPHHLLNMIYLSLPRSSNRERWARVYLSYGGIWEKAPRISRLLLPIRKEKPAHPHQRVLHIPWLASDSGTLISHVPAAPSTKVGGCDAPSICPVYGSGWSDVPPRKHPILSTKKSWIGCKQN